MYIFAFIKIGQVKINDFVASARELGKKIMNFFYFN